MESERETLTVEQWAERNGPAILKPGPDPTPSQCRCSVCHQTFSGITAFDKHRTGPVDNRRCIHPADIGLVPHDEKRGIVWRYPDTRNQDGPSARTRTP